MGSGLVFEDGDEVPSSKYADLPTADWYEPAGRFYKITRHEHATAGHPISAPTG